MIRQRPISNQTRQLFQAVIISLFIICMVSEKLRACNTSDNDSCLSATAIAGQGILSDCLTGCTISASSGLFDVNDVQSIFCEGSPFGTLWYRFTAHQNQRNVNFAISSSEMNNVLISIYNNNCDNLNLVTCHKGGNGELALNNFSMDNGVSYVVAISSTDGSEGEFEFCFDFSEVQEECNEHGHIEVLRTSRNSDLYGPYDYDEIVEICYQLDGYNNIGCNYLQGIIPMFGSGWSDNSFDAEGKPLIVTQELVTQGVLDFTTQDPDCEGDPAGTWLWYPEGTIRYNLNSTNALNLTDNDYISAGWVFLNSFDPSCFIFDDGCCTNPTADPNLGYGDDDFNKCGMGMSQTWRVCMELRTRSASECGAGTDCTVGFKTFGDGEIGTLIDRSCAGDRVHYMHSSISCCEAPQLSSSNTVVEICIGEEAQIEVTSDDSGATFIWFSDFEGIVHTEQGSDLMIAEIFENSGTFYYEVLSSNGCLSDPLLIEIHVTEEIEAEIVQEPVIACPGDEIILSVNLLNGMHAEDLDYVWNDHSASTSANIIVTEDQEYVVDLSLGGCEALLSTGLNLYPGSEIMVGGSTQICEGESAILELNFEGEGPWEVVMQNSEGEVLRFTSTEETLLEEMYFEASTSYYIDSATDANGCQAKTDGSFDIEILESPEINAGADQMMDCDGSPLFLEANIVEEQDDLDISWSTESGEGVSMENEHTAIIETPGIYVLDVQNIITGCESSDTIEITSNESELEVSLSIEEEVVIIEGETLEIELFITTPHENIISIEWSHDGSLDCDDCMKVEANPQEDVIYTVEVADIYGCVEVREVTIHVESEELNLYLPNVMNASLGGENSVFRIYDNGAIEMVEYLNIYDRWGNVIFEAKGLLPDDPRGHWHGTYGGKYVDNGVYVYHINLLLDDGSSRHIAGSVTVAN